MTSSDSFAITTEGLSKRYGDFLALDSLDLKVEKNTIFGFLGPNGAGKTTTIKLLLGLLRPTVGAGSIFGLDIVKDSIHIRSRVGYLSQESRYYNHLKATQILRFVLQFYYTGSRKEIDERVNEMLTLVDLADIADRPIRTFSGGELQRLGIAQAMVNYPDLLILDEPAASLDPIGRYSVLSVMERLREYTTIFYSTHILDDVQKVSDKVAILDYGKLIALGAIEELDGTEDDFIYIIGLKGETAKAKKKLLDQTWIKDIEVLYQNGETKWEVSVSDTNIAEEQILPLLLEHKNLRIFEFKKKEQDLEEIFLNIIGGEYYNFEE
jgi:ABC-2 type transport system ATP-binding protein